MDIMIKATLDAYAPLSQLEIKGINVVTELPDAARAVSNALYVSTSENLLAITLDNVEWITIYPGYVGDVSEGSLTNENKLVNLGLLNNSLTALEEKIELKLQQLNNKIDNSWTDFFSSVLLLKCGDSAGPLLDNA